MLRFNTFLTVVLTFFAFLLAFGGGLLTAIRLSTSPDLAAAPAPVVTHESESRPFPGQPSRTRVSLPMATSDDGADAEVAKNTPPTAWGAKSLPIDSRARPHHKAQFLLGPQSPALSPFF